MIDRFYFLFYFLLQEESLLTLTELGQKVMSVTYMYKYGWFPFLYYDQNLI